MIDAVSVFDRLERQQPIVDAHGEIVVPHLVQAWIALGPRVFTGDERERLDALCRQIDVRRTVSTVYGPGWKRVDPETPVAAETVSGLVAVLLANAGPIGGASSTASADDGGWGLKCANSALKALELRDELPEAPGLRAWALAVLDGRTGDGQSGRGQSGNGR